MRHFSPRHTVLVLLIAIAANRATACITTYTLTPTPPLTANWTDTSIWVPAGVPGSAAGDCVESGSATATTIVVDSVMPNAIEDLQWSCAGCVIEIATGGQLTLQTSGLVDSGGGIVVSGGTFVVNAPGPSGLTFNGGSSLSLQSGTIAVVGTISGSGTLTVDGGTLTLGGLAEVGNYAMTGGVLSGGGFLSAASTFTWSGGTLQGTGTTQIEGTGIGFFDGANGPMVLDGRPFDNYGTISFTALANPLQLGNGAIFSNYGTFSIQDDGDITCDCTTPPLFRNSPNGQVVGQFDSYSRSADFPAISG